MPDCVALFADLLREHAREYKLYGLSGMVPPLVHPLMDRLFESWDPLAEDPRKYLGILETWMSLLHNETPVKYLDPANPAFEHCLSQYEKILWKVVIPRVRECVMVRWRPQKYEPVLDMLEIWDPVLPAWASSYVTADLVLPKIIGALEKWEPQKDTFPVHLWLHPWASRLGPKMDALYPSIRYKLSLALQGWQCRGVP